MSPVHLWLTESQFYIFMSCLNKICKQRKWETEEEGKRGVCVVVVVVVGVLSANALLILHCSSDFTVVQQKKGFGQQSCSSNPVNFYWKASMQAISSNVTKLCRQCRASIRHPTSKQLLTCWKSYANQQPWKQPNRLIRVTIQCSLCGVKCINRKAHNLCKLDRKCQVM